MVYIKKLPPHPKNEGDLDNGMLTYPHHIGIPFNL